MGSAFANGLVKAGHRVYLTGKGSAKVQALAAQTGARAYSGAEAGPNHFESDSSGPDWVPSCIQAT